MADSNKPKALDTAKNKEGDTKKVNRELVLLRYKCKTVKYTFDEKGVIASKNPDFREGDVYIYIPASVTNFYGIVKWESTETTAPQERKFKKRKAYTYTRYPDPMSDVGKEISVRDSDVEDNSDKTKLNARTRKSAVMPLIDKLTAKGKTRTVSIAFPPYFTALMISQALGTMIKKNNPPYWRSKSGGQHAIFYGAPQGIMNGVDVGAWQAQTPTASPTDKDDTILSPGGGNNPTDNET